MIFSPEIILNVLKFSMVNTDGKTSSQLVTN